VFMSDGGENVRRVILDLSLIQAQSAPAKKLAACLAEFETYIRNNREFHSQLRRTLPER
jgi:hypothetical protein